MGAKGIPHCVKLECEQYIHKLYNPTSSHYVPLRSLKLNNQQEMVRTSVMKSGLTDIFLKFGVNYDRVTCTPLTKNNVVL